MKEIKKIEYDGFPSVEITTEKLRLVLVYGIGPRIAFFGKVGGENLLYWDKDGMQRGEWKLYGGHRVWLTRPLADESEDTYIEDNLPCELTLSDDSVLAVAPPAKGSQVERGIYVQVLSDNNIMVKNLVRNSGDLIYSCGVWSPTCINPTGKQLIVPLGEDDVSWDIVKIVIPRIFAGNVSMLSDGDVTFKDNDLVVTPNGQMIKRVLCAPKGKIVLKCSGYDFVKHAPYDKHLNYPFDGCNLAVFVGKDNFMAEMESFGDESSMRPGETLENIEYWSIIDK